jgi:hypothetical protein
LPESSHPPAALTVSGEAGSTTCDGEGEAIGALGAVDACSDEGALVAATTADDGLAAPAQLTRAKTNIAIAAIDRFIG